MSCMIKSDFFQVKMLQFRAINFVPLFHTFTLPVLGDADLDRADRFEGKTSMAFRYKGPCIMKLA